jgi:hypothetical protein
MSDPSTATIPCPPFTAEEREHLRERLTTDEVTYAAAQVRAALALLKK